MESKHKVTILTLYPFPKPGGCFRQLLRAVEGILDEGAKVHYISAIPFPLRDDERLIFHYFPFHFNSEILFYFFFYLLSPFFIFFIILKNNIKKILLFNEEFAGLTFLAKLFSDVKVILLIEGYIKSFAESKGLNYIITYILFLYGRMGIMLSDSIWVVSSDLKEKVLKFYKTKKEIKIHPNLILQKQVTQAQKIDLRKELNLNSGAFLIGCVSSLIARKNISYLLREFTQLSQDNTYLLIIGSGKEREKLVALANRLNIDKKVLFIGERTDSLDVIKSLDLLVLSTLHDDCPLAIIEALNLDIPCLASKRGGIPEILDYDELMFEPCKKGALKAKLEKIINDKEYFDLLKGLCLERKGHFNKDWGKEIVKIIEKL